MLCLQMDAGPLSVLGGTGWGRISEVLLAVKKPPFSLPGSGSCLLSKPSQLGWELIPRHGAILFLLPSSTLVIVSGWLDFFVFSAGGTTFQALQSLSKRPLLWLLHSYGSQTQLIKEPKLAGSDHCSSGPSLAGHALCPGEAAGVRTVGMGGLASAFVYLTSSSLPSCLSHGLPWLLQKRCICFIFPCVLLGLVLESQSGLPGLFSQELLGEMLCFRLPSELGGKPLACCAWGPPCPAPGLSGSLGCEFPATQLTQTTVWCVDLAEFMTLTN